MTAKTISTEDTDRFGGAVMRRVAAACITLLLLGATLGSAGTALAGQHDQHRLQRFYVINCRIEGGKTTSVGMHVVRCDFPNGASETCDFTVSPPKCVYTAPPLLPNDPSTTTDPTSGGELDPGETPTSTDTASPTNGGVPTVDERG